MKKVLVTGSRGFIGKNLVEALSRLQDVELIRFDSGDDQSTLDRVLSDADFVFHLAGVNRPQHDDDFESINAGLTAEIVSTLERAGSAPVFVFASSTQVLEDNPYGRSKKKAEEFLVKFSQDTGSPLHIFRLTNVFGKWCRPEYNSVVATFCHNIAHDLDITISDRNRELDLIYIDDVVDSFIGIISGENKGGQQVYDEVRPAFTVSLGTLADKLYQFAAVRRTLVMPDLSDSFTMRLYATYLSYMEPDELSYGLPLKTDKRGSLAELIKSEEFGQMFVSRTAPGVVRGNHYHDTKVEKFIVLSGDARVRLRHVLKVDVIVYDVSGNKLEVIDIPPGYTHSIENLSDEEMIVLFWASEIFDPDSPDTYHSEV